MSDEKVAVTPIEEPQAPVAEETAPETEQPTVTPIETPEAEPEVTQQEPSSDVDTRQQIEDLKRSVERLQDFIRRGHEEREAGVKVTNYDVPKDPRDFLTKFAENPHEMLEKVVKKAIAPQENVLLEVQRNQAVDYIRNQKDFEPKMMDEILYIVEGPEKNRYFQVGNVSYQLKDLPPRQKVEAALQIYRERSKTISQQQAQQTPRPRPVTTVKTKAQPSKATKKDTEMTADEFLKFHGLSDRVGEL